MGQENPVQAARTQQCYSYQSYSAEPGAARSKACQGYLPGMPRLSSNIRCSFLDPPSGVTSAALAPEAETHAWVLHGGDSEQRSQHVPQNRVSDGIPPLVLEWQTRQQPRKTNIYTQGNVPDLREPALPLPSGALEISQCNRQSPSAVDFQGDIQICKKE